MAKNFKNIAVFALAATMAFTACDDTDALDLERQITQKVPSDDPTPEPDETISLENVTFVAEFETEPQRLYSTDYNVAADYVTYLGTVETRRNRVAQALDLSVLFDAPDDIYVRTPEELESVSLSSTTQLSLVRDTIAGTQAGKVVKANSVRAFRFDQNEQIIAKALEQAFEYGDTIFPKANIRAIAYVESKSVRDEKISNADSLVNNITALLEVSIAKESEIKTRAVDEEVEVYTVEVPYRRIYKAEATPAVDEYVTDVITSGESISNGTHNYWVEVSEVWSVSGQKDPVRYTYKTTYGITSPALQTIYSKNASYTTTGNGLSNETVSEKTSGQWTVTTRTQNYSSTASNGYNPFNNVYTVNDAKVVFTAAKSGKTVEFPYGTWTISEGNSTVGTATASGEYNVYPYVNNIDWIYAITSASDKGASQAKANIYVKQEDKLIDTKYEYSIDIVNGYVVPSVTKTETWSLSGTKISTETTKASLTWSNPSAQSIYSINANYSTSSNGSQNGATSSTKDGNFTITYMTRSYSSTATNGSNPFNNVYTMSDPKIIYNNGSESHTWDYGTWSVVEKSSTVGNASANGNYDVYPYVNTVSYAYSNSGKSMSGTGTSKASIYVEREIDKIIPEAWGKIIGAGLTAVPSDDLGESVNVAKKCLTIRTDKGAVAVVFDWSGDICSVNQVLSGSFQEGTFSADYQSGYWTTNTNKGSYPVGIWAPAIAKDASNGILYYNGSTKVRGISNATLDMWGWANGHSTQVSGYSFSVSDNGTLQVMKDNTVVLTIR